ncbi:MetS family NSS transporter small subunit [Salinibacillus aidingensis]
MTGSAIAMFVIGGVIIWGGLLGSVFYARKVAKTKK